MICIAYCRKAISAPTCMSPLSMRMPPNQMIAMVVKFSTSIIDGHQQRHDAVDRDGGVGQVAVGVVERSLLVAVRLKARMTRTPVSPSRRTRLSLSSFFCIARNSGIAFAGDQHDDRGQDRHRDDEYPATAWRPWRPP